MIMPHPSLLIFLIVAAAAAASTGDDFTFNGFSGANFSLDGATTIAPNGLLQLTTPTRQTKGHAFYPTPFYFKSPGGGVGAIVSFSTTFVFAIVPEESDITGHGIAFVVSHTRNFTAALPNQYMGVFSPNTSSNSTKHILAVELDTIYSPDVQDIDSNHVSIDVNSILPIESHTAGYYEGNGSSSFKNLTLKSGQAMQVWLEFSCTDMRLNVTLAPVGTSKPARPLLSSTIDSNVVLDPMYVGFSASTGSFMASHYILGWSFKLNGTAAALDYTKLPPVPRNRTAKGRSNSKLAIRLPFALSSIVLLVIAATISVVKRRRKYAELLEDWEQEYGPHRFSYKDLFQATNGFKDKDLLGIGGFGRVYRGILPASNLEVAVKRVSHNSKQGMKEFVAEIVSIGQMRHHNIVQLLGYCRRKGELLLVYDYMPNGSLDKLLYDPTHQAVLSWAQRFGVIKGVASGLLYLHEDWEQVVLHRDIKASNVLLDRQMNGRLGDFGLARLYDHGTDPQTTRGRNHRLSRSRVGQDRQGYDQDRRVCVRNVPSRSCMREAAFKAGRKSGGAGVGRLGGRELEEGIGTLDERPEAAGRLSGCRDGNGAEAGIAVLPHDTGGQAGHAAGDAVLGRRHDAAGAVYGLHGLQHPVVCTE